jgi:hypothetical protein
MFHFESSGVAAEKERETDLVLRIEWGRNCVILSGAQQGSKSLPLVCTARQTPCIVKTDVPCAELV